MAIKETVQNIMQRRAEYESKKAWAFEILAKYGVIISANQTKMYHGKVSEPHNVDAWSVEHEIQLGSQKPTLSVSSDYKTAQMNAVAELERNLDKEVVPEVYEIVSGIDESYVLNNNRDFDLTQFTPNQRKDIFHALNIIGNYPLTELAPVMFEERSAAKLVMDYLFKLMAENPEFTYFTIEDVIAVSHEIFPNNEQKFVSLVNSIVGSINAKMMLVANPTKLTQHFATSENPSQMVVVDIDGEEITCPVNTDYVAAWLSNNNIIGVVENANIDNWLLFDLENINTAKAQGEKYHSLISEFGEVSAFVENLTIDRSVNNFMKIATPEEVMELMTENAEFKQLFDAPAGVWEGFSIGQHTETTLRVFEESFERSVPKEIVPFVKMALVCHDIGKGVVKRELMDESTQFHGNKFLDYYGVPEDVKRLLLFALGKAQKYTSSYFIKKNIKAEDDLKSEIEKLFVEIYGVEPTEGWVEGFLSICKIIQTCDSGAYTRYGVTRDNEREVYHKNGNDMFTRSFHKPTDLKRRSQRMIDPKERI